MNNTWITSNGEVHVLGSSLILSDLHIPQHNEELITYVIDNYSEVDSVILNGDTLNLDDFSVFKRKQSNADWETERAAAQKLLGMFIDVFPKVVIICGNHDKRLLQTTNYKLSINDLFRLVIPDGMFSNKIVITDRDYVILNERCRVCHPSEYYNKPTIKAVKLAQTYGMDVIVGHQHYLSKTVFYNIDDINIKSVKGKLLTAIDGGWCGDSEKVEYKNFNTRTCGKWTNGFVVYDELDYLVQPFPNISPRLINVTDKNEGKIIW